MLNGLDLLHHEARRALRDLTERTNANPAKPNPWADLWRAEGVEPMDMMEKPPACELCGADPIPPMKEAFVALRGQWMFNKQYNSPMLVLDPNIKLFVASLPNGQMGLVFAPHQEGSSAIAHFESDCLMQVMNWAPEMFHDHDVDDFLNDDSTK